MRRHSRERLSTRTSQKVEPQPRQISAKDSAVNSSAGCLRSETSGVAGGQSQSYCTIAHEANLKPNYILCWNVSELSFS
jgi:hypothetical protein